MGLRALDTRGAGVLRSGFTRVLGGGDAKLSRRKDNPKG